MDTHRQIFAAVTAQRERIPVRALAFITLLLAAHLLSAPVAYADAGDYRIKLTSSVGIPGFTLNGSGGAFGTQSMYVGTKAGNYPSWSARRIRITVPDSSVRIMGGNIAGLMQTPNTQLWAHIRQGNASSLTKTLLDSSATSSFSLTPVADTAWLEFGLVAKSSVTLGSHWGNWIQVNNLQLTLRDGVDPTVALSAPDPYIWRSRATCAPWSITAADAGSGVWSIDSALGGASTDAPWQSMLHQGLSPGSANATIERCTSLASAHHGTNDILVSTRDFSGRATTRSFPVRVDAAGPDVAHQFADSAHFEGTRPALATQVSDDGSGVDSVTATVDGIPIPLAKDAAGYHPQWSEALRVGFHEYAVDARDAVGNTTRSVRTFSVGDVTPPTVTITSPDGSGPVEFSIEANAADADSALDPATWRISVDANRVPASVTGNTIFAESGIVTAGAHTVTVEVADEHGNVGTATRTYTAGGLTLATGGLAVGSRSGVFRIASPTAPVRFNSTQRVIVLAAKGGRPLGGHRIEARVGDRTVSSAVADAHGVAVLSVVARRPVRLTVAAPGAYVEPASVGIRVRPAITISVSTTQPRRGQPVVVSGVVRPRTPVARVSLFARIGDSWYPLQRTASVDRYGRFRTTVTSAMRGTIGVRVKSPARLGWSQGLSNVKVLTVRS